MNRTELVFILDMSGSMNSLRGDTIGGYNSVLQEQKDSGDDVKVTTYVFNNASRMIHDRLPVKEVPAMTEKDYRPGGCTALVDTLGEAIDHIVGIHRYARREDVPENTVFVIMTDGMENASHRYSAEQVRRKIRHEQEKYRWEFLFLAGNIDAVETAGSYGISAERAVNMVMDGDGLTEAVNCVGRAINMTKNRVSLESSTEWRKDVDEDFRRRKK